MQSKRSRKRPQTDRDNPAWAQEDFSRARKASEVLPDLFGKEKAKKLLRPRGRPKTGTARTSISLRLPPEILARWKASGPGWQTRMVRMLSRVR